MSLGKGREGDFSAGVAQIKSPIELRHLLYRSTFDLALLPVTDISPSALIMPDDPKVWEFFKDPPSGIELSRHTLREILQTTLYSMNSNRAIAGPTRVEREKFIKFVSSVPINETRSPVRSVELDIEIVPIDHALLCKQHESHDTPMRYLDLLTEHGSLTITARLRRNVRGVLHLNYGVSPSHLVLVGTKSRMYFSEFGYVALYHNLFQTGLTSSPWPDASESAPRSAGDPHSTRPL